MLKRALHKKVTPTQLINLHPSGHKHSINALPKKPINPKKPNEKSSREKPTVKAVQINNEETAFQRPLCNTLLEMLRDELIFRELSTNESSILTNLMSKFPSLFIKDGSVGPAVEHFLMNEREILDLLESNYSFRLIIKEILLSGHKGAFVDLVVRNLLYLMEDAARHYHLIVNTFIYANFTQRNLMIRLWRKSITSKRHYEIITKVYPYADKIERKALGNIVEKDAIKSRLEKIASYRKSLPKMNVLLLTEKEQLDLIESLFDKYDSMETRKSLAFSTDEQVQELFSSSRGKTLDAILEHLLPDFHELSQLKHFNNLLTTLYINADPTQRKRILDKFFETDLEALYQNEISQPLLKEMITSSFQNEINYILQWVFPCFEKCLLEPHSGVLLRLFVKGNSETRMKILEHIYRLGVVKTLTDSVASQSVGHIIASGTCSTGELEILLLWISPNLKWLLQNKTSGYIVFNMFINSAPELRLKLRDEITNLPVTDTLKKRTTIELFQNIFQHGSCSTAELSRIFLWMKPEMGTLINNRNSGFSILNLFNAGSADLQSEILKSITKLNVFDILSNDSCAGNVGNLFNYCSNNQVRKLLAWIKPDLELLLKNRTSGFTFLANLFKNGSPAGRIRLLGYIASLDSTEILADRNACDCCQFIISNCSCSPDELEVIFSWVIPQLPILLKNKTAGFAIQNLYRKGSPELRSKLVDSITKMSVTDILTDEHSSSIVRNIIDNRTDLEKFYSWVSPEIPTLLQSKLAGFTLELLFRNGSRVLRSKIIKSITQLNVVDTLNFEAVNCLGNIIENGECSNEEQEMLFSWISPELSSILNNKKAGFSVLDMFKSGSPEIRTKLLDSIIKLDVLDTLTEDAPSTTVGNIIQKGKCTDSEFLQLLGWIQPNFESLLQNRTSGYAIFNIFKNSSPSIRSSLLTSITALNVINHLTDTSSNQSIQLIIQNADCTLNEFDKFLAWILPALAELLKGSRAGFVILDVFKNASSELRTKFLNHLTSLDAIKTLSDQFSSDTFSRLTRNGGISAEEFQLLQSWIPDLELLIKHKPARFAVLNLFKNGTPESRMKLIDSIAKLEPMDFLLDHRACDLLLNIFMRCNVTSVECEKFIDWMASIFRKMLHHPFQKYVVLNLFRACDEKAQEHMYSNLASKDRKKLSALLDYAVKQEKLRERRRASKESDLEEINF